MWIKELLEKVGDTRQDKDKALPATALLKLFAVQPQFFFLPNTQKSDLCPCMQIGSNPGGCWHYQGGLSGSLHFLAIWLLLIKPCVYLLLLFWETTTHCQSLGKQGNAQAHRQAHTPLAKLATKPYKGHNYANTPKCGRMFFSVYSSLRDKKRVRVRVTAVSACQHPGPALFCWN